MSVEPTNRIATIPNLITLLRLLLVPVAVALLVVYRNDVAAFFVFGIAASTDFLDGYIARSTNQVSRLGQQLDPFVDRILIFAGVIALFVVGRVPFWILLVLISRDLILMVFSLHMMRRYNWRFTVIFAGKAATALLMFGFSLLILNLPQIPGMGLFELEFLPGWGDTSTALGIWFLYAGIVLSLPTAGYYLYRGTQTKHQKDTSEENHISQTAQASHNRRRSATNGYDDAGSSSATASRHTRQPATAQRSSNRRASANAKTRTDAHSFASLSATSGNSQSRSRGQTNVRRQHGTSQLPFAHSTTSPFNLFSLLDSPFKIVIALVTTLILVAGICFYAFDSARNWGTIHPGVRVAGIDLGYLTRDEASAVLTEALGRRANAQPVDLFADQAALQAGINEQTLHLESGVANYDGGHLNTQVRSWRISAASLGATLDAASLAEQAFAVGRGADFIPGRLFTSIFGLNLEVRFGYSGSGREMLEDTITQTIGTPLINSTVIYQNGRFLPLEGMDGYLVDSATLSVLLDRAFLGDEHALVVPMQEKTQEVTLAQATAVAQKVETQTVAPVSLSFENQTFSVPTDVLRSWVSSAYERDEEGVRATLVAVFDPEKIKAGLPAVVGDLNPGIAPKEASFTVVDGALSVVPSEQGLGVDFSRLASELNALIFSGDAEGGTAPIPIGPLDPALTTTLAQSYTFADKLAEFTTYYWDSAPTRTNNVHKAAEYANASIIAPGDIWSFNERVGECSLERGFEVDKAIVGDTYEDAIGGGVCQTASTIFNAAYDAGLPIIERSNHAIYMGSYPDGRDAAIAWPYADLKFKNDTSAYMLLTLSYDEFSITAILWGVEPGYSVSSVSSEWEKGEEFSTKEIKTPELPEDTRKVKIEGKDGRSITVTRTVFNKDGSKRSEDTFRSVYNSRTEVVEVGTGPKEGTTG